jgi:hypothetical protein
MDWAAFFIVLSVTGGHFLYQFHIQNVFISDSVDFSLHVENLRSSSFEIDLYRPESLLCGTQR